MSGIITVKDIMSFPVRTVRVDASVLDAVRRMNKFEVGCLVVIQGRRPIGTLTERDVLRKAVEISTDPSLVRVREIMSAPLKVIPEDSSIERAAQVMIRYRIKKLPVVREGKLVGIVTQTDLVKSTPALVSLIDELSRTKMVPKEVMQMYG